MPLQLLYNFSPSQAVIVASVGAANPNTVDLDVTISPPGVNTVTLREIQIQIPVGAELAGDLSDATNLPAPSGVSAAGWTVSSAGSVVTLVGADTGTAIAGPLTFTLAGIAVNQTQGTVPITITEFPAQGRKEIDGTNYVLFKHPASFPISGFWAEPAVLYSLDETVTLYWTCTDQGANCVYSLSPGNWGDCLNGGECLTCSDGTSGVTSGALQETTVFTLQAITGGQPVASSVQITVPVVVPSVSPSSYVRQLPVAGGQVLDLHWLAQNAASCSVRVDGDVIAGQAPADTFGPGFRTVLGSGTHTVWAMAQASQGALTASGYLGTFSAHDGTVVSPTYSFPSAPAVSYPVQPTAVTVAGGTAYVGCTSVNVIGANCVTIDLASATAGTPVPIGDGGPWTLSADGTLAARRVGTFQNINGWPQDGHYREGPSVPGTCGCFTLDNAYFLAGSAVRAPVQNGGFPGDGRGRPGWGGQGNQGGPAQGLLTCLDCVHGWYSSISLAAPPVAITATVAANGSVLALVALPQSLQLVDVTPQATQQQLTFATVATLPVTGVTALAAAPNGSVAVAVGNGTATVIDLTTQAVQAQTIAVGAGPWTVAVTPDATLAFVANQADNTLTVIDLVQLRSAGTITVPAAGPSALAVSKDGQYLVVACQASSKVVIYPPAAAQTSNASG